jgi:hypothetical protein
MIAFPYCSQFSVWLAFILFSFVASFDYNYSSFELCLHPRVQKTRPVLAYFAGLGLKPVTILKPFTRNLSETCFLTMWCFSDITRD